VGVLGTLGHAPVARATELAVAVGVLKTLATASTSRVAQLTMRTSIYIDALHVHEIDADDTSAIDTVRSGRRACGIPSGLPCVA
jgi:hypothetical protein